MSKCSYGAAADATTGSTAALLPMAEQIGTLAMFPPGAPRRVTLQSGDAVLVYNTGNNISSISSSAPAATADPAGSSTAAAAGGGGGGGAAPTISAIGDVCPHKRAPLSDGDIEDLGQELGGLCVRCPKHRRKFNGGGLYFSLQDGKSHILGDAGSCRKYKSRWAVPAYSVTVGSDGMVYVVRRDAGAVAQPAANARSSDCQFNSDAVESAPASRWSDWTIERVQCCSDDSSIYHFRRVESAAPVSKTLDDGPRSWHVTMRLRYTRKPGGKQKKVDREYTPISSWSELMAGSMAILIKEYSDGKLTSRLAQREVGSVVEFSSPEPTLCLVPSISLPDTTLCVAPSCVPGAGAGGPWAVGMVAGGTGIAPMWQLLCAMRKFPEVFGGPGCSARLVFSNRRCEDILMRAELATLVQENVLDFQLLHTITRTEGAAPPESWEGATGRISEEMLLSILPPPGSRTVVVISGPTGLNNTARRLMRGAGYSKEMVVELEA